MAAQAVGTRRVESSHTVTLDAIVRYAGASGDFTPIHWDPAVAAEAGYTRLFAMGMLPAGWLSALLVTHFGDGSVRRFSVRFRSRCWVGAEVRCVAEVAGEDPRSGDLLVDLVARTADGEVLVDGTAAVTPRSSCGPAPAR